MAKCDAFDVTIKGTPTTAFAKIKSDVESNGGTFEGDENSGTVSGNVPLLGALTANYTVSGNTVTITVTDRPLLVPCALIESQARDYFNGL
jgi:hypothetical protein